MRSFIDSIAIPMNRIVHLGSIVLHLAQLRVSRSSGVLFMFIVIAFASLDQACTQTSGVHRSVWLDTAARRGVVVEVNNGNPGIFEQSIGLDTFRPRRRSCRV